MQYLENLFIPLNAGDQLRPFEGLINLTASAHIGKPGTWASYVIAGILEGIQRGGAIALGTTGNTSDAGNPGSKLWADFLTKSKKKQLGDRDVCVKFLPPNMLRAQFPSIYIFEESYIYAPPLVFIHQLLSLQLIFQSS